MYTLDSLSHDQLAYLLFSPTFGNPQDMALQKATQYTAYPAYAQYANGVVNEKESYVCFGEDTWTDWKTALVQLAREYQTMGSLAFDNIPVKVYLTDN